MSDKLFFTLAIAAALLAATGTASGQTPMGTAISYQGRLTLGGSPLTDTADFEFTLWDDASAGSPIGATVPVGPVDVEDGLFILNIPFGVEAYVPNEARWLEIEVRSPSGPGPFTTLSPRQRLMPTPHALSTRGMVVDPWGNIEFDGNVHTTSKMLASAYASNSPWIAEAPAGTVRAYIDEFTGDFGIGTTSPLGRLHVAGSASATPHDPRFTLENSADTSTYRRVSINFRHSNGTGAAIQARRESGNDDGMSLSFKTQPVGGALAERMRVTQDGDVGIGSSSPDARLLVRGEAGEDAFRVRVESATKLLVASNGGVAIGQNFSSVPTDGLRVDGDVGIGVLPDYALHVESNEDRAIYGYNTASSGVVYGGFFESDSSEGRGLQAEATAGSGDAIGVFGLASSGTGVMGWHTAGTGGAAGVEGDTFSTSGRGVQGVASTSSGTNYGVYGYTNSSSGYGVFSQGDYGGTGTKYFIQPHPYDPSTQIHFVCLEGNESGTYFRGSATLDDGRAVIDVPEEFRLVTEPDGLTVQVTATGPDAGLWVESKDLDHIVVSGNGNAPFDYFVNGVRRGFGNLNPIRENHAYVPEVRGVPFGTQYPDELRWILVENGILNADFTPNEATAARMGWVLRDVDSQRMTFEESD